MTRSIGLDASDGLVVVTTVDVADYDWLMQWRWHQSDTGYACRQVQVSGGTPRVRHTVWMHREILATPNGLVTDHINGHKLDNRRINLRAVPNWMNVRHSGPRRDNTSGSKGVYWNKAHRKWYAQTSHKGKRIYLGAHDSREAASAAYREFHDWAMHDLNGH